MQTVSRTLAPTHPLDLPATEIAAGIRARHFSAEAVVVESLRRAKVVNQTLNAFTLLREEAAIASARAADERVATGGDTPALLGVPFAAKDLTPTKGDLTTLGSWTRGNWIPTETALCIERLEAAGAILIGKTTTPEFGHKPFTEGPFFGRTLNPHSHAHTCGGSSGGAAVAVAAGMGQLALGSDGGGSIRIPAACCGVVGLKATLGAIPNLQAPDLFGANSFVGPMARDVADTALMFEALAGPDRRDPYGQAPAFPERRLGGDEKPRIGVLLRCGNILDPDVETAVVAAMRQAEALGWIVEPIELDFVSLEPHFLVFLRSLLLARLGSHAEKTPEKLDPILLATIEAGRGYSSADLCQAQFARTDCFAKVQDILARFDLIASPTLSAPALPVDLDPLGQIDIAGKPAGTIRGAWYPYTFPFNLTGHPALSLPCGQSSNGLPIGLQLVASWHADRYLLDVAARLRVVLLSKNINEAGHWPA